MKRLASLLLLAATLSACAPVLNQTQIRTNEGLRSASTGTSILVGAGDIAYEGPGAEETAKLLDAVPGIVFTLGDNAYQTGSAAEYAKHYHPTWGRHKARTRPVVGNHEYRTPGAAGYFDYFGDAAGDRTKGYYAYDVNPHWRVYVLNSAEAGTDEASKKLGPDSEQYRWFAAELDAHKQKNAIAMWHHPTYSTGAHGDNGETDPLWQLAHAKGVDVILWGHDHHYERFHPMDGKGKRDDLNGIRSFVVGTGGKNHYPFFKLPKRTTAVRNSKTFGVLKLTLQETTYEWSFLPVAGAKFTDSGNSRVH